MKKVAVYGVTRGAIRYLECLLECITCQDPTEDDEQKDLNFDNHFEQLLHYMRHIFDQL